VRPRRGRARSVVGCPARRIGGMRQRAGRGGMRQRAGRGGRLPPAPRLVCRPQRGLSSQTPLPQTPLPFWKGHREPGPATCRIHGDSSVTVLVAAAAAGATRRRPPGPTAAGLRVASRYPCHVPRYLCSTAMSLPHQHLVALDIPPAGRQLELPNLKSRAESESLFQLERRVRVCRWAVRISKHDGPSPIIGPS
jgi:hypothetical protein